VSETVPAKEPAIMRAAAAWLPSSAEPSSMIVLLGALAAGLVALLASCLIFLSRPRLRVRPE
jgi:hypothetical protein